MGLIRQLCARVVRAKIKQRASVPALLKWLRHRIGYVLAWRIRHWWYDTPGGMRARVWGACVLVLGWIGGMIHSAIAALAPHPQHPREAVIALVVWLIIALIVGIAVALSMGGANQPPPDQQANGPTTQDGRAASRLYGTFCITQPAELGWKVVGKVPIYASGGK